MSFEGYLMITMIVLLLRFWWIILDLLISDIRMLLIEIIYSYIHYLFYKQALFSYEVMGTLNRIFIITEVLIIGICVYRIFDKIRRAKNKDNIL